jgi:hypothetical protein
MPEGFQPEGFVSKASSLPLPTGCALRTIASRLEAPLYITHPEPTPSLPSEKHTHTRNLQFQHYEFFSATTFVFRI